MNFKSFAATVMAGLGLLVPASIGLRPTGTPATLYPFPALTFLPALALSAWHLERAAILVPALLFYAWDRGLFRGEANVPRRSYVLLAVVTALSAMYFVSNWNLGLEYQGTGCCSPSWPGMLFRSWVR